MSPLTLYNLMAVILCWHHRTQQTATVLRGHLACNTSASRRMFDAITL